MTDLALVTEVGAGTFQVASRFGSRRLHQQLLVGDDGAILVDAGAAATPREAIAPALRAVGTAFAELAWLVITHPDVDHQGGAHEVLAWAPRCRAACGHQDVPMVADPGVMIADRYRAAAVEHGLDLPPRRSPTSPRSAARRSASSSPWRAASASRSAAATSRCTTCRATPPGISASSTGPPAISSRATPCMGAGRPPSTAGRRCR